MAPAGARAAEVASPARPLSAGQWRTSPLGMAARRPPCATRPVTPRTPSSARAAKRPARPTPLLYSSTSAASSCAAAESCKASQSCGLGDSSWGGSLGSERLLSRLGMLSHSKARPDSPGGEQKLALRLPASAPKDLKQCQEGCCWRWLVHTMLEEVGVLKKGMDEAHEELVERSGARRGLEQVAEHRTLLENECSALRNGMEALEAEVLRRRKDREDLLRQSQDLAHQREQLFERRRLLTEELREGSEQEKALEQEVKEREREAQEAKVIAEALLNKISEVRKETARIGLSIPGLSAERDRLKEEVEKHDKPKEVKLKSKPGGSARKAK